MICTPRVKTGRGAHRATTRRPQLGSERVARPGSPEGRRLWNASGTPSGEARPGTWLPPLVNGEDVEARPDEEPYPARLVLDWCADGALHVAVRDNIDDDEIIIETAYRPDPALWEPDFRTRRPS
jgi:hypothetical protein